jgi:hypothetical protein
VIKWLRRGGIVLLLFGVPALIVWHDAIWWWIEVHTGTVNESGPFYGFFSGFGSDLGEYAILTALTHGLWMHWRSINCHDPDDWWRIGKYPAAGGAFKFCHLHHPDFAGEPPTREHMHRKHREHTERLRPAPKATVKLTAEQAEAIRKAASNPEAPGGTPL